MATETESPALPITPRQARAAAVTLKKASDPARLLVLALLSASEANVGAITAALGMTQPAVSHHLALLRHGRIIECRRDGKNNVYTLTAAGRRLADVVLAVAGSPSGR